MNMRANILMYDVNIYHASGTLTSIDMLRIKGSQEQSIMLRISIRLMRYNMNDS